MSKRPDKKPKTVNPLEYAGRIQAGLRQEIATWDILRRYEDHYNRVEPYLNEQQRFYLQTQFARHEANLEQRTGMGPRPSTEQIAQQKRDVERRINERPEEVDFDYPTGSGDVRRKRTRSEEELSANEVVDWGSLFDSLDRGPSPPPPPPPAGGGGGPISI